MASGDLNPVNYTMSKGATGTEFVRRWLKTKFELGVTPGEDGGEE